MRLNFVHGVKLLRQCMNGQYINGNPRLVITDKPVTFHEMASKCFELDIFTNGHADFDKLGIDTGSVASRSEKQNSCNDPQAMIQKVF